MPGADFGTKMKAFMLHGERDLRAHDLTLPTASPGHVLLRVKRAGICGSDMHYYRHARNAVFFLAMYPKNEKSDLSPDDKKALKEWIRKIIEENYP